KPKTHLTNNTIKFCTGEYMLREKLNSEIKFRLDDYSKQELTKLANNEKISVSEYLRKIIEHEIHHQSVIKNTHLKKTALESNAKLNNSLQKYIDKFSGATNNINQISKKTHQNNSISNENLETIIQNQKEMQKILVRIFKGIAMLWRQYQSKKHKI